MASKVTIYDVAERAGVSVATVNRVINSSANVSERTRIRVEQAIREMDFVPSRLASRISGREIKIAYLHYLPELEDSSPNTRTLYGAAFDEVQYAFLGAFLHGIMIAARDYRDYRVSCHILCLKLNAPAHYDSVYSELIDGHYSGVIIGAQQDEYLEPLLLSRLKSSGIRIASYGETRDSQDFSIAKNGYVTGKLAAELLSWTLAPGDEAALFTSFRETNAVSSIEAGFHDMLRSRELRLAGVYENRDDPTLAYYSTAALLREHPNIKGIYVCSANSQRVCQFLTENGSERKIRLVTSDIFPSLTPFIRNGTVQATLFQNQGQHGYNCLSRLYRCISENAEIQNQLYTPQIVTSSNLDDYLPFVDLENAVHENAKRGWNILQE